MHLFQDARSASGSSLDEPTLLSSHWAEQHTFLLVAKMGSVTRAAEQMGASRSTINRQLERLQDVVGARLLTSSKTGVALTPKGLELAKALARFDRDLFAATRDIGAQRGSIEGVVRLSCPDGLGLIVVTPGLKAFSTQYPGIQIHLNSLQNYRTLRDNSTDCMISFSRDTASDLTNIQLGWLHLTTAVSRSYVEERGLPSLRNLRDHDFLDTEKYSALVAPWLEWQALVKQGRTRHFSDNAIIYANMVKAGLGIGLVASYTLQDPAAVLLPLDVLVSLPLFATFLNDRLRDRPVAIVRDFLTSLFANQPWFGEAFVAEPARPHPGMTLFNEFDGRAAQPSHVGRSQAPSIR